MRLGGVRSLPLQMAFAVNHAIITLTKKRVFCTEPFRVPFAGTVNVAAADFSSGGRR